MLLALREISVFLCGHSIIFVSRRENLRKTAQETESSSKQSKNRFLCLCYCFCIVLFAFLFFFRALTKPPLTLFITERGV